MSSTVISLCARALIKIGAKAITSFRDGTAESEVALHLYDATRDALLSAHPWRFATAQKKLPELLEKPFADYAKSYALPSDFLRAISAGSSSRGQGIDYRIHENKLHTNAVNVTLTYIFRSEEESFPPFFTQCLISKLAAEFCLPLTESSSRSEYLYKLAEEEFKTAKLIDAQQAVPQAIRDFPLVGVRF